MILCVCWQCTSRLDLQPNHFWTSLFYWEKAWVQRSWQENLASEFSSFKAEVETVELVKSDSGVVNRGISTLSWRRERSELDLLAQEPREKGFCRTSHLQTYSMTSGSWSSSTISHIFCSVEIQHHSVAFDVQVQNIDTTLRIYEQGYQVKSSDQLGILEEQSLSKALNFAKVFVCMFFESLVKSGTITVINKIRLSTSMRPRGPIDVHFPKCIYKFRVAIVSQTCVNLTV